MYGMNKEKVAIVTDSTACIPGDIAEKFGIEIVPVVFIFGRETFRDGIDMTTSEFYTRLRKAKKLPTTSGSLTMPYLEAYRKASQRTNSILCITISSKLSGMLNSARVAREMAQSSLQGVTIEIIDSGTAAGAQGLVVTAAARATAAGKSLLEVIETTKMVTERVRLFAMLDTLNYLVKGGRAPRVAAIATSLLKIKPIITINSGVVHPVANVITAQHALQYLVKIIEEKTIRNLPLHLAVMHADARANAKIVADEIKKRFQPEEILLCEFTPVMGVHTGPGLVGVAFYNGE